MNKLIKYVFVAVLPLVVAYIRRGVIRLNSTEIPTPPDVKTYVFSDPDDATRVLAHFKDLISDYGYVSMADLLDLMDLPTRFKDSKWGWKNINGMSIESSEHGYELILPQPAPLD